MIVSYSAWVNTVSDKIQQVVKKVSGLTKMDAFVVT